MAGEKNRGPWRPSERMVLLGAFLAVVAMGALLVWFVALSGLSEPVQFVYGGSRGARSPDLHQAYAWPTADVRPEHAARAS